MSVDGTDGTAWPRPAAGLEQTAEAGILDGVVAGIPMGLFAMVASATWLGEGLYTPAYRVALMVETTVLDTALREAAAGDRFYLSREALAFGLALHCFVAGALGAGFALAVRRLRPRGTGRLVLAGVGYALAAGLVSGLVVLPALARLMGLGAPVGSLPEQVGWAAFLAAHAIYGLGLGLWPPLRALARPAPGNG